MSTKPIVVAFSLFVTTALAETDGTPSPIAPVATLEANGPVEVRMFLREDWRKGRLHSVAPQAENDGLLNTYFLSSGGEEWAVTTGLALQTRIRELYAIDKLRGMSKTEAFTQALSKAAKQKVKSVAGIVK